MKKTAIIFIALLIMLTGLTACGGGEKQAAEDNKDSIRVVTTIFPVYDWVRNIAGDNNEDINIEMLIDSGVDLHSYQPTADDILKISTCDLFIYVGGESDEWVEDALKESMNENMKVINLLETLGGSVREEEIVEGMQAEHDHDHADEDHEESMSEEHDHEEDHDHEEEDHEEGETEYDEHVWLSLRNAAVLTEEIGQTLEEIDPENADVYAKNMQAYQEKLAALDAAYQEMADAAPVKTLLFGDRFPFRYMTEDYGLDYYAAFAGCSAETEASFETIMFLAEKLDELSLHTCLTIEGTDHRIAQTIVSSTKEKDQQILSLDSMQGTTSKDLENGVSYLSVMENNLEVLRQALK